MYYWLLDTTVSETTVCFLSFTCTVCVIASPSRVELNPRAGGLRAKSIVLTAVVPAPRPVSASYLVT